MAIGMLGWFEAIKNFFKWLIGTYLEYNRKKKARAEQKKTAKDDYKKAQANGDATGMLNAFEKMKRGRNE